MAIPTITSITPNSGPTGGRTLVEIIGTNFRLPPAPPVTGPTDGVVAQTVRVTFDGAQATNVRVLSATRIWCNVPRSSKDPNDKTGPGGLVNVVLVNLNDDGDPITGESVTKTNFYTYVLPVLAHASGTTHEDLVNVIRQLMREIKRQVTPNVDIARQIDYDPVTGDSLNYTDPAGLPAIILSGPDLVENRLHRTRAEQTYDDADGEGLVRVRRTARCYDLLFDVFGLAQDALQRANLMWLFALFIDRNPYLSVTIGGQPLKFELDFTMEGAPKGQRVPMNANVVAFTAQIRIWAVDLAGIRQFTNDDVVDRTSVVQTVTLDLQKHTDS